MPRRCHNVCGFAVPCNVKGKSAARCLQRGGRGLGGSRGRGGARARLSCAGLPKPRAKQHTRLYCRGSAMSTSGPRHSEPTARRRRGGPACVRRARSVDQSLTVSAHSACRCCHGAVTAPRGGYSTTGPLQHHGAVTALAGHRLCAVRIRRACSAGVESHERAARARVG